MCWSYRNDVGAYWGIKGYEEQVSEVGTEHGHLSWPQYRRLGTFDSVFARNCGNCHGIIYKKYDTLLDKAFKQLELANMVNMFSINPAHHHFKQYYYQEWQDRDRLVHDRIYPPYYSLDEAKNANGGVWPTDFSKLYRRPGGLSYVYNILTGYHYKPPYGIDIPKGKSFNPYFDHMIMGMPRAFDVSNFINFMQRRYGYRKPDRNLRYWMVVSGVLLIWPFKYLKTRAYFRNLLSVRWEMYAVRDGVYYNHFRHIQKNSRAGEFRSKFWL